MFPSFVWYMPHNSICDHLLLFYYLTFEIQLFNLRFVVYFFMWIVFILFYIYFFGGTLWMLCVLSLVFSFIYTQRMNFFFTRFVSKHTITLNTFTQLCWTTFFFSLEIDKIMTKIRSIDWIKCDLHFLSTICNRCYRCRRCHCHTLSIYCYQCICCIDASFCLIERERKN